MPANYISCWPDMRKKGKVWKRGWPSIMIQYVFWTGLRLAEEHQTLCCDFIGLPTQWLAVGVYRVEVGLTSTAVVLCLIRKLWPMTLDRIWFVPTFRAFVNTLICFSFRSLYLHHWLKRKTCWTPISQKENSLLSLLFQQAIFSPLVTQMKAYLARVVFASYLSLVCQALYHGWWIFRWFD